MSDNVTQRTSSQNDKILYLSKGGLIAGIEINVSCPNIDTGEAHIGRSPAHLEELVRRLKQIAKDQLGSVDLRPTLTADAEVPLKQIRPDLINALSYLEPTGYGNRDAAFVSRGVRIKYARTVGSEGKHLKLTLEDDSGYTHDAIGFRLGHLQPKLNGKADILFTYETNEYNGRVTPQLNLKDLKPIG